jgi:RNA polymerase sigma-70 factor (ECF subfamily)
VSGDPVGTDPRELDRLVAGALAGERGAMDTLLRILRPLVVRYCRSRLGGYDRVNATPDDVAQEVCLAVLRALPTYQDQGRPFLAFVYGIAQHKVVDAHRSAGRDRSDPVDELPEEQDVRDGPEQHALNLSDSHDMASLLAELPEKQREVLRLRVVVGLSAEETAEAVGSTAGAVRVAQHRALTRLRQLIVERGGEGAPAPEEPAQGSRRRSGSRGPRRARTTESPEPPPETLVSPPETLVAPPVEDPSPTGPIAVGGAWQAAPRTGIVVLDRLLQAADAHVAYAAAQAPAAARPMRMADQGGRQDVLDAEDAAMAAAARRFRGR